MKTGDFIVISFEEMDIIGEIVSDEGDTFIVLIDNDIYSVPKQYCRLWIGARLWIEASKN